MIVEGHGCDEDGCHYPATHVGYYCKNGTDTVYVCDEHAEYWRRVLKSAGAMYTHDKVMLIEQAIIRETERLLWGKSPKHMFESMLREYYQDYKDIDPAFSSTSRKP
jgi:hypothetical protein